MAAAIMGGAGDERIGGGLPELRVLPSAEAVAAAAAEEIAARPGRGDRWLAASRTGSRPAARRRRASTTTSGGRRSASASTGRASTSGGATTGSSLGSPVVERPAAQPDPPGLRRRRGDGQPGGRRRRRPGRRRADPGRATPRGPVTEAIARSGGAAWAAVRYAAEIERAGPAAGPNGDPVFDVLIMGVGPGWPRPVDLPGLRGLGRAGACAVAVPAPTHVEPHVDRVTLAPAADRRGATRGPDHDRAPARRTCWPRPGAAPTSASSRSARRACRRRRGSSTRRPRPGCRGRRRSAARRRRRRRPRRPSPIAPAGGSPPRMACRSRCSRPAPGRRSILVHGTTADHRTWRGVGPDLATRWRLHADRPARTRRLRGRRPGRTTSSASSTTSPPSPTSWPPRRAGPSTSSGIRWAGASRSGRACGPPRSGGVVAYEGAPLAPGEEAIDPAPRGAAARGPRRGRPRRHARPVHDRGHRHARRRTWRRSAPTRSGRSAPPPRRRSCASSTPPSTSRRPASTPSPRSPSRCSSSSAVALAGLVPDRRRRRWTGAWPTGASRSIDGARHGAHHSHAAEFIARVEAFVDAD